MATKAKKVKALPATKLKMGKEEWDGPPALGKLARDGYDLKQEMDRVKTKLDEINAKIFDGVSDQLGDAGTIHVLSEGVCASVALREKVDISDPEALEAALGERFPDLVKVKVSYAPEKKLVEIALDPSDPLAESVRGALTVKTAKPSVTYSMK
jgi:hypothetical protein